VGRVGESDVQALNSAIKTAYTLLSERHGLKPGQFPYSKGELASGWTRQGNSYVHDASWSVYTTLFDGVTTMTVNDEIWLILDTAMNGRYPGDPGGLIRQEHLIETGWKALIGYHYPESNSK